MNWVQMEPDVSTKSTSVTVQHFSFGERVQENESHLCTFHLKGVNADVLEKFLMESSDPGNPNYGKRMSKQEVDNLTKDQVGFEKVSKYLGEMGATIVKQTNNAITAQAPILAWEKMLHTEFFTVTSTFNVSDQHDTLIHKQNDEAPISTQHEQRHTYGLSEGAVLFRAKQYFLPEHLAAHVSMVSGTIQLPTILSKGPVRVNH